MHSTAIKPVMNLNLSPTVLRDLVLKFEAIFGLQNAVAIFDAGDVLVEAARRGREGGRGQAGLAVSGADRKAGSARGAQRHTRADADGRRSGVRDHATADRNGAIRSATPHARYWRFVVDQTTDREVRRG